MVGVEEWLGARGRESEPRPRTTHHPLFTKNAHAAFVKAVILYHVSRVPF